MTCWKRTRRNWSVNSWLFWEGDDGGGGGDGGPGLGEGCPTLPCKRLRLGPLFLCDLLGMALLYIVGNYLFFFEEEEYRELYRKMDESALDLCAFFEVGTSRGSRFCIVSDTGGLGSLFQYSIPYEPGWLGFLPELEDMGYCSLSKKKGRSVSPVSLLMPKEITHSPK